MTTQDLATIQKNVLHDQLYGAKDSPIFIEVNERDICRAVDMLGKTREYIEQNIKEFKETHDLSLLKNKTWKIQMEKDLQEADLAFYSLKGYIKKDIK